MTKNRKRKQDTRAAAGAGKYTSGLLAEVTDPRPRLKLPLPAPYTGPGVCRTCTGTGVRDWAAEMGPDDATSVLVCPVFCGTCHGCGRAEHDGCRNDQHDDPEELGLYPIDEPWDDDEDEDDQGDVKACPSCRGRRWWAMQAFDKRNVYWVRVPCGCSEPLLVPA
jgi:hypothetical protein